MEAVHPKKRKPKPKCAHGTRRGYCKVDGCDSRHLCVKHKITRSRCKDENCGGGSELCVHKILRNRCKDEKCGGGSALCAHKISRSNCKDETCEGGGALCVHKIPRSMCNDETCEGGGGLCVHKIPRSRCKIETCGGGGSFCVHKIQRSKCKIETCGGGGSLCVHKIVRSTCKDVTCDGGGSLCIHNIQRSSCNECVPLEKRLTSGRYCVVCTATRLSWKLRRVGVKQCATCDPLVPDRIELVVRPLLVAAIGVAATIADDKMLGGTGCDAQLRRPDTLFVRADEVPASIDKPCELVNGRAVFVEIDEKGGHPDRESSCEAAKAWDQSVALKKLCGEATQVFVVRFNPDEYDGAHVKLDDRIAAVGAHCRWLLETGWSTFSNASAPHISFHYYHSKCAHHIEYVRSHPDSFHLYHIGPIAIVEKRTDVESSDESDESDCEHTKSPQHKRLRVDGGGGAG